MASAVRKTLSADGDAAAEDADDCEGEGDVGGDGHGPAAEGGGVVEVEGDEDEGGAIMPPRAARPGAARRSGEASSPW